jgi:hypothetical protein
MFFVILLYGKMHEIQVRPHSSVDRALPSGGRNPRSSRGGGTEKPLGISSGFILTTPTYQQKTHSFKTSA